MRYRHLGKTGYRVSEIGFGCWGIGGGMWRGSDDGQSMEALHEAVDSGINFFDTALGYGDGHSERLVGRLLSERGEALIVATKIPPKNRRWPAEGTIDEVFPPDHIRDCVRESQRNLGMDTIPLIQLHVWNPRWLSSSSWYDTLSQLQEEGSVACFGVSVNDHDPDSAVELVGSGRISTVQVIYNIFDPSAEESLFPACEHNDVGVIARVPFDEGALTGQVSTETKFARKDWRNFYFRQDRREEVQKRVEALRQEFLREDIDSPAELALRFCLHPTAVSSVIAGMRRRGHVTQNTAASDKPPLSEAVLERLRRHRWAKNFYKPTEITEFTQRDTEG